MKILCFHTKNAIHLGVESGDIVTDVTAASQDLPGNDSGLTPDLFFAGGIDMLPRLKEILSFAKHNPHYTIPLNKIKFAPAVPCPQKIICIGLNYRKHAAETGMALPSHPVVFGKFANALSAHKESVLVPPAIQHIDYEAELAVVIGKRCVSVKKDDALSHVLGYTCGNDLSARDAQMLTSQWMLGKSPDGFCPLGPRIVTPDEIADPQNLSIETQLNGDVRQNSNTSDMIFTVAEIIAHLSRYWTLLPGDVILTGTPEGVIMGRKEKVWMKSGDRVNITIESIGTLTTAIS